LQASYGVEDPEYAITQLAQTTMRSEIGKITLDTVFRERESLNINIVGEWMGGGDKEHLKKKKTEKKRTKPTKLMYICINNEYDIFLSFCL
jgi:hypothetical protein